MTGTVRDADENGQFPRSWTFR